MASQRKIVRSDQMASSPLLSQGVQVGNLLFTCGCLGLDSKNRFVSKDFEAQCHQALKNVGSILSAAGTSYANVVKVTVYLADLAHYNDLNRIYSSYFKESPPVRTAFQVAKLPLGGLIEVEAIAVVDNKKSASALSKL